MWLPHGTQGNGHFMHKLEVLQRWTHRATQREMCWKCHLQNIGLQCPGWWGRFWDVCSWLEYIAVPAVGCTAIPLWSALAVKRGIFKSPRAVVRLLCWPVGLIQPFIALQGLLLGFSLNTEKQHYGAALGQLELHPSECSFFQGGYGR